jgi:TPR repeat protein
MRLLIVIPWLLLTTAAGADYEAGCEAHARGDYQRALAELVPAADHDARAARALVQMYELGQGVVRNPQQALLWRRQAAELGDSDAQLDLARRYAEGKDVAADPRAAAQWYERAAHQGIASAQFALGTMLVQGQGVAPDADRGRRWIEQAAAGGSREARAWLGWPPTHLAAVTPATGSPDPKAVAPPLPSEETKHAERSSQPAWPDIHTHWSVHYGRGWYPYGWHPYGWYPDAWYHYGYTFGYPRHPHSSFHFGFTFVR